MLKRQFTPRAGRENFPLASFRCVLGQMQASGGTLPSFDIVAISDTFEVQPVSSSAFPRSVWLNDLNVLIVIWEWLQL